MVDKKTEHRIIKVGFITGLTSVMTIIMQIISVRICLVYWGNESYGMWLSLISLFLMIQSTGSGFVNYIGNQINILYHKDINCLRKTLASSIVGIILIASIQFIIIVYIILFDNLPNLLGVTISFAENNKAELSLLLLSVSWILGGFYLGVIHRLSIPTGMMAQACWWSFATQLILFLIVMVSAYLNLKIYIASLVYAIVQFLLILASALYNRYKLPQFNPWLSNIDLTHGFRDLYYSMGQTISGLIQQGTSNGLVVLISFVSGASSVPVFTTVRTLTNLWTNITNILTSPLLPDLVRFYAIGDQKKIMIVNQVHNIFVGTAVNLSIIILFPFISTIFNYWTNNTINLNNTLLCFMLSSVSIVNFYSLMNLYFNSVNNNRVIIILSFVRSSIVLCVGGVLLLYFGLGAFGFGIWLSELVVMIILSYIFIKPMIFKNHSELKKFLPAFTSLFLVNFYLLLQVNNFKYINFLFIFGVLFCFFIGLKNLDSYVKNRIFKLVQSCFI